MYVFGEFNLDVEAAELRRGEAQVPLRPKCYDLLLYLIRHPGKLITKNELLDTIWSGAVVSEATLSRTVAALRASLQDEPEHPTYIETVSRRGYKFIAPVEELGEPSSAAVGHYILVHGGKEYPLRQGVQIIGRGRDSAIPLFTSATSRHHARIILSDDSVVLEDLGSRNGTYVNGERLEGSTRLQIGDRIQIGGELLVLWSPTGDTAPGQPPVLQGKS